MQTLRSLVIAIAVTVAAMPVAAQSRQDQQMAASLLMIQEQQQMTALALAQLTEVVKALNPRFDEVVEALRKQMANLELTIRQQGPDISAIRAQTQETGTRIGSLSDEIEAMRKTMDALGQAIVQLQQMHLAPPVVDPNAPPGQTSQTGAPPAPAFVSPPTPVPLPDLGSGGPARMLSEARADYQLGRNALALTGFEGLIKAYPGTQAAEEAHLLIGHTYSNESRWTEAIAAYNTLIKSFPKSQFVPDAYFRRGMAESALGQGDAARATWEFVAKTYPETDAGRLARQRLPVSARP